MKTYKFVPTTEGFEGDITLRSPSFDEKYELLESLNYVEGEKTNQIATIRRMVAASKKFVVAVDLKCGGEEFKSFDDMTTAEECHPVLVEMATQVIQGKKLGNGSKPI